MTQHVTRFIIFLAFAGLTGCDVPPPDKLEPSDTVQRDVPSERANGTERTQDTPAPARSSDPAAPTSERTTSSAHSGSEAADRDIPVWTSIRGDTIQADFLRMEGSLCVFRTADGTLIRVPLDHLSGADAERAEALAAAH